MIVAFSFHAGDVHLVDNLLRWIGKLSDCSEFDCILVCDCDTPFDRVIEVKQRAEGVFKSATLVHTEHSVKGWPQGCNNNWETAIRWGRINKVAFLFLEPDAIPIKPTWLVELAKAYADCEKQHLGSIYDSGNIQLPPKVMSGVAVYGPSSNWPIPKLIRPWNVDMAELLLAEACHTDLIKDFFGQKDLPPFFVGPDADPRQPCNALTLDWLPESAVLFHRDKTQSLIPLLAKRLGMVWDPPRRKTEPIAVVFNVHRGDIHLAMHHSLWLRKLGRKWNHPAIVAYDPTLGDAMARQLQVALSPCFSGVDTFRYQTPPVATYPATANWAFQSVAIRMSYGRNPWLWFESDAVALTADWLDQLQAEYERCGKSWMGPHVDGMQHANGTMVYPPDAARRMPATMSCGPHVAFDMAAAEVMSECHDCKHLLFHTWSILSGGFCPVGGGVVPAGITPDLARQIPRSAVMIHRIKDRSLIDLLLSGQYVHH